MWLQLMLSLSRDSFENVCDSNEGLLPSRAVQIRPPPNIFAHLVSRLGQITEDTRHPD
jgi:hypothetical protein